jgi:hypothetical protein
MSSGEVAGRGSRPTPTTASPARSNKIALRPVARSSGAAARLVVDKLAASSSLSRALAQELYEERVRLEHEPVKAEFSAGFGDESGEAPEQGAGTCWTG